MNSLTRIMSYDKTKIENQENCNCEECVGINDISEKKEIVGNFRFADDFLRKIENYRMMCKEKKLLTIINLKYWYKDKKTKTFIWKVLHIHDDKYDYSNTVYIKAREDVEVICKVKGHKPFPITPDNHLRGRGCRLCAIEKRANNQRMTLEEFIKQSNIVHNYKYDYSKVNYINMNTNVIITCPIHGDFPQEPRYHLEGHGCKLCAIEKRANELRMTLEEFIEYSNEVHGIGTYDYSKVNYVNMHTEVIIICPKHGNFPQTPSNHLNGQGCYLCGLGKRANNRKLTTAEFIEKANKVQGIGRYDYSKVDYVDAQTEVIIICPNHEIPYEFPQTPNNHLSGHGCSLCNESLGAKKIRLFLVNNNIEFEREKRFNDCKDKRTLPFDFYLPFYNLCIEYDGKQHFEPYSFKSKNESEIKKLKKFETIQKHDQIKNNYCKEKGINLLRIKYDENVEEKLTDYFQNL